MIGCEAQHSPLAYISLVSCVQLRRQGDALGSSELCQQRHQRARLQSASVCAFMYACVCVCARAL